MGISARYTSTHGAWSLLLLGGLALGCNSNDISFLNPSALDQDPPAPCEVAFVTPAPGNDPITLGPSEEQDGEACGTDFTISVDVTTNADRLTLLVDNQPTQTLRARGPSVHFENVVLGTRSPDASALKIRATMQDGRTCEVTRESLVVDCAGPSCTLEGPNSNPVLNSSDDGDLNNAGLQADFRVVSNVENLGQPTRLIIDDDLSGALAGLTEDENGTTRALYQQITLAEGPARKVQAECEDAVGNVTRSTAATWGVDVTPCGISIASIASGADPITRAHDTTSGGDIQVPALGQVTGSDCTGVRLGVCGASLGDFSGSGITGSDWTAELALADVTASGQACAQVQDAAGNVAEARQAVNVRSLAPVVAISSPPDLANINLAATNGAIADLVPSSGTCEANFTVDCTEVGASVELIADDVTSLGQQPCVAVASLPAPYLGRASFSSISLSSLEGAGQRHSIAAKQTVAGLTGSSVAVSIGADCVAPTLALAYPACGSQLNVSADDQQPDPGVQHDVEVANGGVAAVELTVARAGGSDVLSSTGDTTTTTFTDVNFGTPGDVTLTARATDPAGNVGTASCQVTVVSAPTVDILVPAASALLTTANDCGPLGGGYGITVSGNTGAAAGSDVDVAVGSGSPVDIGTVVDGGGGPNTFSGCISIADGLNQTLTVTVTDGVNPPGSDTVTVSVDSQIAINAIAAPTVEVMNAREGTVKFTWNHVEAASGGLLAAYEMHCASTPIVDESDWSVADPSIRATGATRVIQPNAPLSTDLLTAPALTGSPPAQETLASFRVGTSEFCVIRGRDGTGALTPLRGTSGNAVVTLDFVQTEYTVVLNGTNSFTNVIGLGDINGDGADDMMYGVTNQGTQIFFGGNATDPHPFDTIPDISITGTPAGAFGAVAAPLGDVNGDGIADFAVSARAFNGNRGTVFVFFGKPGDTWGTLPVVIDAAAGGCGADVCLVGSAPGAFFGWDITGTNFDGTGPNDVVVSARASNGNAGSVYVILGGSQFNVAAGTSISVPGDDPDGFVIDAPANRSNFGVAVAAVGTGADGRGDLGIGANGVSGDTAELFYLAGEPYPANTTGLIAPATSPLGVAQGSSGDYAVPVRAIGDFDGDGFGDLALGRNFSASGGLGASEVYLRNEPLFVAGPGFVLSFPATGTDNDYGTFIATGLHPSLGPIGDLDGDGATELALGSLAPNGSVSLFYGSKRQAVPVGRTRSSADFIFSGSGTSLMVPNFVGDIDHDGFHDLAIVDGGAGTDKVILLH